jgi:hypothetical protein
MDLIIYKINMPNMPVKSTIKKFIYDSEPAPKLLKFGFNKDVEKLDIASLMNNPNHKIGLNFDFERTDEASIEKICHKKFGWKISKKNNMQLVCSAWEIISLFFGQEKKKMIATNEVDILEEVSDSHKKKFKSNFQITNLKSASDIVYWISSKIELDENVYIHLLISELSNLLSKQKEGSCMVIQLFGLSTQIMSELIYILTTLYHESYIIKPSTISDLSDEKYLVLINMINSKSKIDIGAIPKNTYLNKLELDSIPDTFINSIQCINAKLIPKKLSKFNAIKKYIDNNIYEGMTHDEMIATQNLLTEKWVETFSDQKIIQTQMDLSLNKSGAECDHAAEFNNLYALI